MKSVCDALTKRAARSALAVSARGAGAGPILTPTDRQREAFFKQQISSSKDACLFAVQARACSIRAFSLPCRDVGRSCAPCVLAASGVASGLPACLRGTPLCCGAPLKRAGKKLVSVV